MRIVQYRYKGRLLVGALDGDEITAFAIQDGLLSYIRRGITPQLTSERVKLADVDLTYPLSPGKIVAVGRNYAAHAAELDHEVPKEPLLFVKLSTSVIGINEPICWHRDVTTQVDWEGELAVIIGKTAYRVSEDEAMNYVYGYTVANDVSARDLQDKDNQWIRAKGLNTFCPLGPSVLTRSEIDNPHDLMVTTTVNGEQMQHASTANMIYKIPGLIAYCSQAFTLEPGDVILTGTPEGVGKAQNPPRFLQDGDRVSVTIDGIGTLTNPCEVLG
jgi:2-keto-4-pentenoate hydratase/2-oxohepta-3-ene-1,7-dioic acid hydratase in catechol pathway